MADQLDFRLGPYAIRPISDEQVVWAYLHLREQGLLGAIFYEGDPGIRWFLNFYDGQRAKIVGAFRVRPDGVEDFVGLGWINSQHDAAGFSRADAGMAFFRHATVPEESTLFGRMLLAWGFQYFDFDVIYGTTPDKNRAAVGWMRRVGFEVVGPIPFYCVWGGALTGGMIGAMSRERMTAMLAEMEV